MAIRYNLNENQKAAILEDLQEIGKRILGINFTAAADDAQNIRHHAYLKGKFDAYRDILEDNFPDQPLES